MKIDKLFSQHIENCIKQSHVNMAEKCLELGREIRLLNVGSGTAFYLGNDSFFSQVVAWGFDADISLLHKQLKKIEKFYTKNRCLITNIELSPLCGMDVTQLLSEEGYKVTEFSNISIMDLNNYSADAQSSVTNISVTNVQDLTNWGNRIAIGFDCPEATNQFQLYAQSKNVVPFHFMQDGEIAAGGTVALHGEFCDLGVTSTLPKYRGKGIQKSLLHARLTYAKMQGSKFAIVATEPGSISDINIQKIGFRCAYTRIKFSKELKLIN